MPNGARRREGCRAEGVAGMLEDLRRAGTLENALGPGTPTPHSTLLRAAPTVCDWMDFWMPNDVWQRVVEGHALRYTTNYG